MAISLSVTIRNSALNDAFKPANIYLEIPNIDQIGQPPNLYQPALFANATNGTISLATPVQFAVPSLGALNPTVIDMVQIVTGTGGDTPPDYIVARINLEGDEIETFEENGVYIIDEIHITLE